MFGVMSSKFVVAHPPAPSVRAAREHFAAGKISPTLRSNVTLPSLRDTFPSRGRLRCASKSYVNITKVRRNRISTTEIRIFAGTLTVGAKSNFDHRNSHFVGTLTVGAKSNFDHRNSYFAGTLTVGAKSNFDHRNSHFAATPAAGAEILLKNVKTSSIFVRFVLYCICVRVPVFHA